MIRLEHLVALKLQVHPEFERDRYAKDMQDLLALRERGLIDGERVRGVLADVGDPDAQRRLRALMSRGSR